MIKNSTFRYLWYAHYHIILPSARQDQSLIDSDGSLGRFKRNIYYNLFLFYSILFYFILFYSTLNIKYLTNRSELSLIINYLHFLQRGKLRILWLRNTCFHQNINVAIHFSSELWEVYVGSLSRCILISIKIRWLLE